MIPISRKIIKKGVKQLIINPFLGVIILEKYFYDKIRVIGIKNRKAMVGPENANLSITNTCNYKCIFCSCHSNLFRKKHSFDRKKIVKNRSISLETFNRFLDSIHRLGTRLVNVAGTGEPLLHPNIVEMISYANKKGILMTLSTNGELLNNNLINKLIDSGLNGISISLNAGTNETYMKLHPTAKPDTFEKIKKNIKLLSKSNIIVRVSFVLNKLNCHEVDEMVKTAIDLDVDVVDFLPFKPYKDSKNLKIPIKEQTLVNQQLKEFKKLLDLKGTFNNICLYSNFYDLNTKPILAKIMCYSPYSFTHIREDGSVHLCCLCGKKLGNINKNSFKEIWFSKEYSFFRNKVSNAENMSKIKKLDKNCSCGNCLLIRDVILEYRKVWRVNYKKRK